jgi:hypothetical protein
MTPTEITSIFTEAALSFPPIAGKPMDNDCTAIRNVLLPIIHNIDYDMNGLNNLNSLIEGVTAYTATWGQAFTRPAQPTNYNYTIANNAKQRSR